MESTLICLALVLERCPVDKALWIYSGGKLVNGISGLNIQRSAQYYMYDELALQILNLCELTAEEAEFRIGECP